MTKLLILSDSHNSRLAIENILAAEADSIDALIFLGDGLRDAMDPKMKQRLK